jgi:hypothetical protein
MMDVSPEPEGVAIIAAFVATHLYEHIKPMWERRLDLLAKRATRFIRKTRSSFFASMPAPTFDIARQS